MNNTNETNKLNICPHCDNDLFEVGITEILMDCIVETKITFNNVVKNGNNDIQGYSDQYIRCNHCNNVIYEHAIDLIELFNTH